MAAKEEEEEEVKLLKTWSSLFALRVVWALKLKGIPYESFDEDIANKSDWLLDYNPVHKKVPVLIHNGRSISESLVILEYIDETFNQNPPALFPQDPLQRGAARFWSKFGDEMVLPQVWKAFTTEGRQHEQELAVTAEHLKLLEEELKGKKFFGGEELGIVDIALGWVVNLVPVYEEILGLQVLDKERYPSLWEWMQRSSNIPAIKESWPAHEKLVTKWTELRRRFLLAKAATEASSSN